MNNPMTSAVRKIHNLLSSGAVTVTGPNQPRILKQKISPNTVASNNNIQVSANRCYVCDDALAVGQAQHSITEMQTTHTLTKFPNKIGHLVGEAFTVIISADDVVCARCTNLINYLDRLENDVERVRSNLINLLHKKYGLNDDGGGGGGAIDVSPPKMQKLNSGATVMRISSDDIGGTDVNRTRKIVHMLNASDNVIGKQSPPVSAVQQIKISTQPTQQITAMQLQSNASFGTQTIQRKTTRIYKCLTCDYKTSDMRLFNTHYETCKQQNFQCKNCKKIFPNFGTMKQHMVREHNTSMDNTCSVCHINYVSEVSLRKHMELNHSTNVLVTTTVPAAAVVNEVAAAAAASASALAIAAGNSVSVVGGATTTQLYNCAHCQFKSTDKVLYDEHMRKHLVAGKPKPFKCRLCSQRFETREAATVHAKQHQPNYFKCRTCSMSFSKREQLVKHFEVHQQQQQQQQQQQTTTNTPTSNQQHNVQQINLSPNTTKQLSSSPATVSQNLLTTQKLLQETIDEALSDTVVSTTTTTSTETASATASNIRFYSCQVCSLTFLQENYYNQHMETHRRDEKKNIASSGLGVVSTGGGNSANLNTITTTNALSGGAIIKKGDNGVTNVQQIDPNSAAEADIESIFEKMHSDKSDSDAAHHGGVSVSIAKTSTTTATKIDKAAKATNSNGDRSQASGKENLVITSQEGSGGITFNITIPETAAAAATNEETTGEPPAKKSAVSIDMPTLDQADDIGNKLDVKEEKFDGNDSEKLKTSPSTTVASAAATAPVSMPSLDDDGETTEQQAAEDIKPSNEEFMPVEQIKAHGKSANEALIKSEGIGDEKESNNNANPSKIASSTTNEPTNATETSDDVEKQQTDDAEHQQAIEEGVNAANTSELVESGEGLTPEQLAAAAAAGEHQQVAMELDEAMQAQVESGQIKFILNDNGQLLHLDNHILTDAEGNQILVQDPEQIQQLLQSVGVLQSGDAIDGETLQMMTDNGQMVLVHGENNETQLIDASLLNAEGQLVIQQGQDGELGEGTHVISGDGTRIPVSLSYTADGQPIVQVQQVLSASNASDDGALEKEVVAATGEPATQVAQTVPDSTDGSTTVTTTQASATTAAGSFLSLEDLMQQQQEQQHAAETKAAE